MCMETIVITLCTWFFLSHTEQDREGKTKYRRIAAVLYCAGLAGLTAGLADGRSVKLVYMVFMTMAAGRRLYSRDLTALGPLERGEARRSFAFAAPCWRETRCPAQLFRESFFQRRLRPLGRAWWRREGELLLLALPLEPGAPFPLEALFCLGRVEQVEGTRCVVYAFREEEPAIF